MYRRVLGVTIVDGHVRSVSDIPAETAKIRERQPESATVKGEEKTFDNDSRLVSHLRVN